MHPIEYLAQFILMLLLFLGAMPVLGGCLIHYGMERGKIDRGITLWRTVKIFLVAAGCAYVLVIMLGWVVPGLTGLGVIVAACIIAVVEVPVICYQLRPYTKHLAAVVVVAVLVTNATGYAVAWGLSRAANVVISAER
jgi:hypothetical protein